MLLTYNLNNSGLCLAVWKSKEYWTIFQAAWWPFIVTSNWFINKTCSLTHASSIVCGPLFVLEIIRNLVNAGHNMKITALLCCYCNTIYINAQFKWMFREESLYLGVEWWRVWCAYLLPPPPVIDFVQMTYFRRSSWGTSKARDKCSETLLHILPNLIKDVIQNQ